MHPTMPKNIAVLLFFFISLSLSWNSRASDFNRLNDLLKQNNPKQGYRILSEEEDHHLGEVKYDLLLGRTALESGHAHEAIFAYERVLLNQPGNDTARFGLAVAYYRINENERAQQLFDEVLGHNPPQEIRLNIQQYLGLIESRQASLRHKLSGKLALRKGWDSNINSATNDTTFELLGQSYPLSEESRETEDTFSEIMARLNYSYTMNNNADLFSQVHLSKRDNLHNKYDTELGNLQVGGSLLTSFGRLRLPLTYQTIILDNQRLRTLSAIAVNLAGTDKKDFITTNLQYGQIRYPDQPALNVNQTSVALGYVTTNQTSSIRKLVSLYYGDESATSDQYRFNARKYYGVQGRLFIQPARQHLLEARLSVQNAKYKQKHPFFSQIRDDQLWSASVAWSWWLTRSWSLETRLETSKSDSGVNLYDFQRNMMSMGVNYHL